MVLLNNDDIAAITAPLGQARTLPPDAYRLPEFFAREQAEIFHKEWLCVARQEQLPNPGDYLRVDALQQPLIIVRQESGELLAMSALCVHRGMPLVTDAGHATHFQCPYHLWRYDQAGRLTTTPLMERSALPEDCRLPLVALEVWQGFVFVNLDPDAAPLAPRLRQLDALVAPLGMAEMVCVSSSDWDCPWNWKILIENFMEAYHHLGPHSESVQPTHPASASFSTGSVADGWSVLSMPRRQSDAGPDTLAGIVMPSFCWLSVPETGGVFWYQLQPAAHDRMTLRLHTLLAAEVANSPARDEAAAGMQAAIDSIHREDILVNAGPWAGMQAPLAQAGYLAPLEESIWQFNQWWLARVLGASHKVSDASTTRETI